MQSVNFGRRPAAADGSAVAAAAAIQNLRVMDN
jgi:hypothetical protein